MWFRNLQIYRFNKPFELDADSLNEALESKAFKPCGSQQPFSAGWTKPLGKHGTQLVHATNGKLMVCAKREERIMPAAAVRDVLNARIEEIEAKEDRKVRGKEKTDLKDEVIMDMLPRAFTRSSLTYAYIDPQNSCLIIDAASVSKAEELTVLLRDAIGTLPVRPLTVNNAPYSVFTQWLKQGHADVDFALQDSCELKSMEDGGGTVRISKQELVDSEEVQVHLEAGKLVTKLALTYKERIRFTMDDTLVIKQFKFLDVVTDVLDEVNADSAAAEFDAKFAIMALELEDMLPSLAQAFGGEPEE